MDVKEREERREKRMKEWIESAKLTNSDGVDKIKSLQQEIEVLDKELTYRRKVENEAIRLMEEGKYEEANVVLRRI